MGRGALSVQPAADAARRRRTTPAIAAQPIAQPIFIAGLPRSGTSFLHSLLMQDPGSVVPRVWQTIYPYPAGRPGRAGGPDRRIAMVDRQLRAVPARWRRSSTACTRSPRRRRRNAPKSLRMCSPACGSTAPITCPPTEPGWTARAIWTPTGFIGASCSICSTGGAGRRWVLKCPDHVFALDGDPAGLSGCTDRVRAPRPAEGAGLGGAADRSAAAPVHAPARPRCRSAGRKVSGGSPVPRR